MILIPRRPRLLVPTRPRPIYRVDSPRRTPIDFTRKLSRRPPRRRFSPVSLVSPYTTTTTSTTAGCCCPAEECDCPCCPDGYWSEYTFTITGIGDNGPDCDCELYNGAFTVIYVGACVWITADTITSPCHAISPAWELACSSPIWTLGNQLMGNNVYSGEEGVDFTDFCLNGGPLTGGPSGGVCQNFAGPFIITVSPGGVWIPCP